ncbi:MAG: LL-diaminopimelate aminotransferase [Hyphomonas sp.]|uniref:LL-diaminopimelate aminotransferase n=1 Tax=Hyphomonas sp. TaxID=87 RepID=UPI0017FA7FE4|nr:LL-diaminopimelate aminotransferase [Hyphomonas sp.]MBU3922497.1 LL-diaminopimelate aminotransferase [Alphaproteobacteria bacterium]MBA3067534.1 LL-diaminopimelate aminotransferase [Hyphomonas sp.]MBU4063422.1 LL-diaminopimelate aminotransferase [Alphaproteobacteria bacterium]MBU4165243.1 LL-diaminopimelate aminotransferase [Alphaproteobacteria bacterium]MBU4568488.1 LL-diaminopimelate aminotransferase [Alphaproteobacteria bacterium]
MNTDFHKIRRLPPYVFEQVNRTKAALRAKGADIIDLGMGNPDLPTPKHIVDKLVETARKPDVNGYSASRGIPGLRRALTDYYKRRFGVVLDKEREVIVTLGSKEGFANLAQAISAPGDVILAPDPSYPLHHFGFIIAGASIRGVPAHTPEQYLSNLGRAVRYSVPPPTAMVLCFPSNPTAAVCDLDFYKEAVKFAKKHDLWILSDLAYNEIYFEEPTPSILQVDGAKDIAVEFTTMSKTYSMAGWRIGFVAGNDKLIAALARVKSYLDYGAYTPIQVAAAAALDGPQDCVDDVRRIYRARRDVLVDSFTRAGWPIPSPKASMFAWAQIPEKLRHMGSLEFALAMINEAHVAVAPGAGFGEHGDEYVRIALVENEQRIRQAGRNIRKFLATHGVKEIKPVAAE